MTASRTLLTAVIALVLAPAWAAGAEAAPQRWVPVAGNSEVSFAASFPLGTFTGRTADVSGEFEADPADLRQGVTGALRIKAGALRTGDDGRDRDMYDTLAVAQYPEIRFAVERIEASFPAIADRTDVLLTIHGVMSIRGVDRPMAFPGRVRLRDNRLWVRGEGELRMSDFGVRPPSRFFMKVKDAIFVNFDVTLARE